MTENRKRVIVKNCSRVKEKVLSLNPCTSLSLFHLEKMEKVKKKFMGSIHISLSTISETSLKRWTVGMVEKSRN